MNVLCTFCLRGGSKGVKNKNFLSINKIPLYQYSFEQGIRSNILTKFVVSSDKIYKINKHYLSKIFII